jgi:UDP-3-O-[3-hydroxymyristoyl] N-acetylglucosamine deacetylase
MQHTLASTVTIEDIGLHSGTAVRMTLYPAPADTGISFIRTDVTDRGNRIPARWDHVVDTQLCTVVGNDEGVTVGTVEHLMAALRGCEIDNVLIEIDGPEVPAMDGSAAPFVKAIDKVGIQNQPQPRTAIKVLKPVHLEDGDKVISLLPSDVSSFGGTIDFDHDEIGAQDYEITLMNGNFRHNLADARTFGFLKDVEMMQKHGLALGGSLENAIVLDDNGVMNPDGLRHKNEFIRHKLLDAIGDLYLAGGPIIGAYHSMRAGHELNNRLLHKLFATKDAWCFVRITDKIQGNAPEQNNTQYDNKNSGFCCVS